MTKQEIKDLELLILNYINKYSKKEKNHSQLAFKILGDNPNITISHRSLRKYISQARDSVSEDTNETLKVVSTDNVTDINTIESKDIPDEPLEVVEATEADTNLKNFGRYSILENSYVLDKAQLGIDFVDAIFCAYSRRGLNLTGPKIRAMMNISQKEFNAITNYLEMSKECNPYSPHSELTKTAAELNDIVQKNTKDLLDILHKDDHGVLGQLIKSNKEVYIKSQTQDLLLNSWLDSIEELLPKVTVSKKKITTADGSSHVHLIIPDIHLGLSLDNYNLDIALDKLLMAAEQVSGVCENVHVYFMGDIIHSVTGLNHPDSWKEIEPGIHGAAAIVKPFETILTFLNHIENLKSVNIVGGNHDRMSSSKAEENTAEGAKLIAYMLGRAIDCDVNFDPNYVASSYDPEMEVIILHGDNPVDKEPVQDIAFNYGDSSKFNLVLTAHMHSRKQDPKQDGLRYRKVQLGPFCPSDAYSKTVSTGSTPGFYIAAMQEGAPIILDYGIKYDKA